MGSKTYEGVRFSVYPNDHLPPHVHGTHASVTVIVDLLPNGCTQLSERRKAIRPRTAAQNTVAKILRVASENADELQKLWESTHGKG
ncbi:MAG: DUF4160 domain-containing protein [Acidobacteriota bacterium]